VPTGPKGEKRPADVIGNAVRIMQIATGEIEDTAPDDGKDKAAQALGAKGGRKRAESMTPEQRAENARVAAMGRWDPTLPKAVSGGVETPIKIAGIEVPCYVLDDDRRVIATSGMLDTLQLARGGSMIKGMNRLELFVSRERIKPFISNELLERIRNPVRFRIGNNVANGYTSDTLIDIAEAVIAADNSPAGLQKQQAAIAYQCRIITSALTRIGLVALIDEATGHQTKRDKDALQQLLGAYLLPEHRPWMKTRRPKSAGLTQRAPLCERNLLLQKSETPRGPCGCRGVLSVRNRMQAVTNFGSPE
jgi:hypothetical protein